jgi:hypothetical protein
MSFQKQSPTATLAKKSVNREVAKQSIVRLIIRLAKGLIDSSDSTPNTQIMNFFIEINNSKCGEPIVTRKYELVAEI